MKEYFVSLDVYLKVGRKVIFSSNITHNLTLMASRCGVYYACWRPEEINCKRAKHILPMLKDGIETLQRNPDHYKKFDAPNGWGKYEHFLRWLIEYAKACEENPDALIKTWK